MDTMTACTTMMTSKLKLVDMVGGSVIPKTHSDLFYLSISCSCFRYYDEFGHDDYNDPDYGFQDDPCT